MRLITLLLALFSLPAFGMDDVPLINPQSNGTLTIKGNKAGVVSGMLKVDPASDSVIVLTGKTLKADALTNTVGVPVSLSAGLTLGDGTVGAPALTFTNELTSGLYRAGANDLRVSVGGADKVKVTSTAVELTPATVQMATSATLKVDNIDNVAANGPVSLTHGLKTNTINDLAGTGPVTATNGLTSSATLTTKAIVTPSCALTAGTGKTIDGTCAAYYSSSAGGPMGFAAQSGSTGIVLAEGQQVVWSIVNSGSNFTITWPSGLTLKWRFATPYSIVYAGTANIYTFVKLNGIVYVAVADQMN
jgi:hypothetical protein